MCRVRHTTDMVTVLVLHSARLASGVCVCVGASPFRLCRSKLGSAYCLSSRLGTTTQISTRFSVSAVCVSSCVCVTFASSFSAECVVGACAALLPAISESAMFSGLRVLILYACGTAPCVLAAAKLEASSACLIVSC